MNNASFSGARLGGIQRLTKYLLHPCNRAGNIVARPHGLTPLPGEDFSQARVFEQPLDRVSQGNGVARRGEEAGDPVNYQFRNAGDSC
jgi:hypothetical protein